MTPAPSTEDHAYLRSGLMKRGQDLSTKLSELMSGKDGDSLVAALGLNAKPGATPEEILRQALADNEQLRHWLDDGDARYGVCGVCGVELGLASMREVPWADRCHAHAGGAAPAH
jgi:RNA polymerase-binding transcription factor DksA